MRGLKVLRTNYLGNSYDKFRIFPNIMQVKFSESPKKMMSDYEHLKNFVGFFPKPQVTNAAQALGIHISSLSQYLAADESKRVPIRATLREQMRKAGYDFETGTIKKTITLGQSTGYLTTLQGESSGNAESLYPQTDENERKDLTGEEKSIMAVLERYGIHTVAQLEEWLDATDAAMDLAEIFGSLSKLQQLRQLKTLQQARK